MSGSGGPVVLFQSTFPQGERLPRWVKSVEFGGFQSTFPQGERRVASVAGVVALAISIHVPTRGTTICLSLTIPTLPNFNPRSHKGNDLAADQEPPVLEDFNPRSHKGNDLLEICQEMSGVLISIHVPTRGTTSFPVYPIANKVFQSTFPQGERH